MPLQHLDSMGAEKQRGYQAQTSLNAVVFRRSKPDLIPSRDLAPALACSCSCSKPLEIKIKSRSRQDKSWERASDSRNSPNEQSSRVQSLSQNHRFGHFVGSLCGSTLSKLAENRQSLRQSETTKFLIRGSWDKLYIGGAKTQLVVRLSVSSVTLRHLWFAPHRSG